MQNIFYIYLLSLLSTGIVRADLSSDEASHVTGAVRIKRSSITEPVKQCISQSNEINAENCPHRVNNWSDVHCINNSFGLYTPQSQFMNLGTGPLGINLNDGFVQTVSYLPVQNAHHSQEEGASSKRIEGMIEEKAKLEMKVSFFESRFSELERENEELRKNWQNAEEERLANLLKIKGLTMQLSRWEAGAVECKNDMESEQKKASVAFQIASSHISQLENENGEYMNTNKQLAETVAKLRTSLDNVRGVKIEYNGYLSACKAKLNICEDSERETALSLEQQTQSHEVYVTTAEKEYNQIHNQLEQVRVEISECTASLDVARDRNNVLQKSRDTFISRLSKESTLLKQCNYDLQNCHSNHSESSNQYDECRDQIGKFSYRFSHMQEQYMTCTSDLTEIKVELKRSNEKNTEQSVAQARITTQLEYVNHQNTKLEERVSELVKRYDTEQAHHKAIQSNLQSCLADLRTITETVHARKDEIAEAKQYINELHLFKAGCIKESAIHAKEAAVTMSKLKNMEAKEKVRQKQVDKYQTKNDELLSMTSTSQGELSTLRTMHAVAVSQRDECMTHNNVSIQKLDEWKGQYLKCNSNVRNITASLMKCQARHELQQEKYKALEQEAQTSLNANENLSLRLSKSTKTIVELTHTLSEVDTKVNDLTIEDAGLTKELKEKETLYLRVNRQYTECSNNYSQSLQLITELQHNQQFSSELMDALKKQAKDTSDQLVEAKTSLSHQHALLNKEKITLLGLETTVKMTQELYDNEHRTKLAVDQELQLCRSNHTEVLGQAQLWQIRLNNCSERISQMISTHHKQLQEVEATLVDLTETNENAAEVQGQVNASLAQCENQQTALRSEHDTLQHKMIQCSQAIHIHMRQIKKVMNMKVMLKQRFDSCSAELREFRQLLKVRTVQIRRCNEGVQQVSSDLELIRTQLKQCNAECPTTKLACPEGPNGETYVLTSSGCFLQTSTSGSEKELETYCHRVNGHLLTLQASDERMNKDIMNMLKYSGEAASLVWVTRPDQHEGECFSVDMSRVRRDHTKPVEYIETPCDRKLPGICFYSLPYIDSAGIDEYEFEVYSSSSSSGSSSYSSPSSNSSHGVQDVRMP